MTHNIHVNVFWLIYTSIISVFVLNKIFYFKPVNETKAYNRNFSLIKIATEVGCCE